MVYVAIAAGGSGQRMGADLPKQFIEICGKPIIIHTIERFISNPMIDTVFIGINLIWADYLIDMVKFFCPDNCKIKVVSGGEDRNQTIQNIIEHIETINDDDIIITHDAVRPFVTDEIINNTIEYAAQCGACGTYLQAVDTIAVSECGNFIKEIPHRKHMYQVQTPQSFNLSLLKQCYEKIGENYANYTDTCAICAAAGVKIRMVSGENRNIKITTPFDLIIAKAVLEAGI